MKSLPSVSHRKTSGFKIWSKFSDKNKINKMCFLSTQKKLFKCQRMFLNIINWHSTACPPQFQDAISLTSLIKRSCIFNRIFCPQHFWNMNIVKKSGLFIRHVVPESKIKDTVVTSELRCDWLFSSTCCFHLLTLRLRCVIVLSPPGCDPDRTGSSR